MTPTASLPLKLSLTRLLAAPRPLVWEAWTKKEHLDRWSCPRDFFMLSSEGDFRVGGAWRICMRAPDGERIPASGVYKEIVPLERLVMTHGWIEDDGSRPVETVVTVTFADEGGKTRLTFEQEGFASPESRDRHVDGWGQCLDKLAEELAGADRTLLVVREIAAPRELVWQAMTDPLHVVNWWGPNGFTTTIEEMDLRVGGKWKHVMRGPDGTEYPNESVFTEIVPPSRLAFSHAGARAGAPGVCFDKTWTFDELGKDRTRVTLRMVFPTAEARDTVVRDYGAAEGAKQTLARLAGLLEQGPLVLERVFAAPVGLVWKAITEPDRLKAWFAEFQGLRAEVGAEATFTCTHPDGKDYPHVHRVTEVVAEKRFAYTWTYRGYPGESLVTFELFPEGAAGDKTRLRLTHSGLETFPQDLFPRKNFQGGWSEMVGRRLGEFLAKQAATR